MMCLKIVKVEGSSMEPFLRPGQFAIIRKTKQVKIGDVICFPDPQNPKLLLIKRVQAINDNSAFVIGDNLTKSRDSRHFGMISKGSIIGKLLFKI
ncbi:MAG: nickel-type superoxide dismutase maturation protease [Methanobacteriota archaeon]|nr:MAG: nickel-type superoxide dismutase maturation protease [Euryarchaeota archaeon]